jgi:hypothetical protein
MRSTSPISPLLAWLLDHASTHRPPGRAFPGRGAAAPDGPEAAVERACARRSGFASSHARAPVEAGAGRVLSVTSGSPPRL